MRRGFKCARCGSPSDVSRHHVYPRRFSKKMLLLHLEEVSRSDLTRVVVFCSKCHINGIELIIPDSEMLLPSHYLELTAAIKIAC